MNVKMLDKPIIVFVLALVSLAAGSLRGTVSAQDLTALSSSSLDSLVTDPHFRAEDLSDSELDAIDVNKKLKINDYSMIGFQYGVNLSRVYWTPSYSQKFRFLPYNFGITFTRYGKMFGFMPYFGFQVGVFFTQEGYKFDNEVKKDSEKKYYSTYLGSKAAAINEIEVPVLAHFHMDFWKMKVMVNAGFFGGYRLSINRLEDEDEYNSGDTWQDDYAHKFASFEKRLDYGLKGGVGFAFIFDPIEIHFTATYKHSFSSLCHPDYSSNYYYRYAYPMNITVSAGVHFQLTKRSGKTKHELRREARTLVYGKPARNADAARPAEPDAGSVEPDSGSVGDGAVRAVINEKELNGSEENVDGKD